MNKIVILSRLEAEVLEYILNAGAALFTPDLDPLDYEVKVIVDGKTITSDFIQNIIDKLRVCFEIEEVSE